MTILRRIFASNLHKIIINNNIKINKTLQNKRCFSILNNNSTILYASASRKFTEKHEWIETSQNEKEDVIGKIGITNYAQDSLGDIVYVQLPEVGQEFAIMSECGTLESVKAASELYCPVSGKITEKNAEVEETPALINQSCNDKGWLFKIQLTKPNELDELMSEEDYNKFIQNLK